jgi:hypothetical protein
MEAPFRWQMHHHHQLGIIVDYILLWNVSSLAYTICFIHVVQSYDSTIESEIQPISTNQLQQTSEF